MYIINKDGKHQFCTNTVKKNQKVKICMKGCNEENRKL